jgi:L-aminoadipate-semialdehyde dehydrogenase
VRRYIDGELHLKAEIPSLRIGDSGVLSGGEVSGKGLFARVRTKASSPLDKQVGPDGAPTLSFVASNRVSVTTRWPVTGSAVQR